ncbi:MAG: hypothetical protein HY064_04310 [Bacteroidetes bacterium]|nr:hypothetical protein [Bacteroidota bacterium]
MIGWIVSSIGMFGLSYFWHGIVCTDYSFINYPLQVYLSFAAVAYLFIGFVVSKAFTIKFFDKLSQHPLLRGPMVGFACGVLVYIIATVVHVNFNKDFSLKFLVLDITWQGIEQALGGFLIGIIYMLVFEPFPHSAEEEND